MTRIFKQHQNKVPNFMSVSDSVFGRHTRAEEINPTLNRTCPFCDHRGAHLVKIGQGLFNVICWDCGASGPRRKSRADTIKEWNRTVCAVEKSFEKLGEEA